MSEIRKFLRTKTCADIKYEGKHFYRD